MTRLGCLSPAVPAIIQDPLGHDERKAGSVQLVSRLMHPVLAGFSLCSSDGGFVSLANAG